MYRNRKIKQVREKENELYENREMTKPKINSTPQTLNVWKLESIRRKQQMDSTTKLSKRMLF